MKFIFINTLILAHILTASAQTTVKKTVNTQSDSLNKGEPDNIKTKEVKAPAGETKSGEEKVAKGESKKAEEKKDNSENPEVKILIKLRGSRVVVFAGNIERSSVSLPSKPVKFQLKGKRFYAACRKDGLIIVDFTDSYRPYIYKVLEKGKDVVDFNLTDDSVSVISAVFSMNAHTVSEGAPPESLVDSVNAGKIDGGRITGERGKLVGTIINVSHGYAVFKIEKDVQVREGFRVEVRTTRNSGNFYSLLGFKELRQRPRTVCIANISEIKDGKAVIELGRGDSPEKGDKVYFSERPISGSRYIPARLGGIYRLGFEFIPVFGGSGGDDNAYLSGLILARATMHLRSPFSFSVGVTPFQFAGSSNFSLSKYSGANMYGLFTYEVDQFAIGLGFGYQQPILRGENPHNRYGVTLVQYLRLGSHDGLNLTGELHAVYSDDNAENSRRAMMGMLKIDLNVPLTDSITFFSRYMGDGRTLIHFSGGLKTMLSGKGGRGTLVIPVTIGYTSMTPWYDTESKHKIQGSSFSIGIEKVF